MLSKWEKTSFWQLPKVSSVFNTQQSHLKDEEIVYTVQADVLGRLEFSLHIKLCSKVCGNTMWW